MAAAYPETSSSPSPLADRFIFEPDGEVLVPCGLARGPWYPNSQHGSSMLGILARAVENHPSDKPMQVVRLVVDLARAAPLGPVTTPSRTIRAGKTVETIEAAIEADGKRFATATAMRIRVADVDVSHHPNGALGPTPHGPPPSDQGSSQLVPLIEGEAFHHALDIRITENREATALWYRMLCPLVAGEETSPFVRAATLADWTYSVPIILREIRDRTLHERTVAVINPDAAIHTHRPMNGEWLCLESAVRYGPHGAGTANAQLYDRDGSVGHTAQSILIRPLEEQPLPA